MNNSIQQLKAALSQIETLSFGKVDWPGIRKSLYRSVKRGMKAFAAAQADDHSEKFHEWRKRAKDLRYQLSLFAELHPDLKQYSKSAKKLEQLLGDDHNLAILAGVLSEAPLSDGEPHSLPKKIGTRQRALRKKARKIGRHLYGEKRKVWKRRLSVIDDQS
jgi:CHAD domain-containing protein